MNGVILLKNKWCKWRKQKTKNNIFQDQESVKKKK